MTSFYQITEFGILDTINMLLIDSVYLLLHADGEKLLQQKG